MCLTAAVSLGPYGVLATDRARNLMFEDGSRHYGTTDGRLRGVPGGYVVASGDVPMMEAGFDALARTGLADVDTVRAVLATTLLRLSPAIRKQYPGAEPARTAFLALRETGAGVEVLGVSATGKLLGAGSGTMLATWPPELAPDAVQKMDGALRSALGRATGPEDAVRAVVEAASIVSPHCATMSNEIELAVLRCTGDGFTSDTKTIRCTPDPTAA